MLSVPVPPNPQAESHVPRLSEPVPSYGILEASCGAHSVDIDRIFDNDSKGRGGLVATPRSTTAHEAAVATWRGDVDVGQARAEAGGAPLEKAEPF